jgi:hypothetical protein
MEKTTHSVPRGTIPGAGAATLAGPGFMTFAKEMGWTLPFPVVAAIGVISAGALLVFAVASAMWGWRWFIEQRQPNGLFGKLHTVARQKLIPLLLLSIAIAGVVLIAAATIGTIAYLKAAPALTQADINNAVASIQVELDEAKKKLNATTAPVKLVSPNKETPKRYTAYEKEQRLRAVDEFYNLLAGKMAPLHSEARELMKKLRAEISQDTRIEKNFREHSNAVEDAFKEWRGLLKKYEYFPDIGAVITQNKFNGLAESNATSNLANEIVFIKTNTPEGLRGAFLDRDVVLLEATNGIAEFEAYLNDTLPKLRKKREDIEAAEIFIPNPTEIAPGKKSDIKLEGNGLRNEVVVANKSMSGQVQHDMYTSGSQVLVGPDSSQFELRFSVASSNAVHVYKDKLSYLARIRGRSRGDVLKLSEYPSAATSFVVSIGEHFIAMKDNGQMLQAKIMEVKDDRSAEHNAVTFDYVIAPARGGDFIAL